MNLEKTQHNRLIGGLFEAKNVAAPKLSYDGAPPPPLESFEKGDFVIYLGMRFEQEPGDYPGDPPPREFFYKFLWKGKNVVEFQSWLSYEKFFDRYFTLVSSENM